MKIQTRQPYSDLVAMLFLNDWSPGGQHFLVEWFSGAEDLSESLFRDLTKQSLSSQEMSSLQCGWVWVSPKFFLHKGIPETPGMRGIDEEKPRCSQTAPSPYKDFMIRLSEKEFLP